MDDDVEPWRRKLRSLVPPDGVVTKHIRTGEPVALPRKVVAAFALTMLRHGGVAEAGDDAPGEHGEEPVRGGAAAAAGAGAAERGEIIDAPPPVGIGSRPRYDSMKKMYPEVSRHCCPRPGKKTVVARGLISFLTVADQGWGDLSVLPLVDEEAASEKNASMGKMLLSGKETRWETSFPILGPASILFVRRGHQERRRRRGVA